MHQNQLKICLFLLLTMLGGKMFAQPKSTYYTASTLDGKNGQTLELALKNIVYTHTSLDFDDLWTAFKSTDVAPKDSIPSSYTGGKTDLVYDMYAWISQFPKFYSDNDHTQTSGFNREHLVPNSWWGGKTGNAVAYTDLFNLYPGDGAANNAKGNYALGEYGIGMTLTWPTETKKNTSNKTYMTADTHRHAVGTPCYQNASHVWKVTNSSTYGGSTNLFEPADVYKGDIARAYFYMVCAYEGEITWESQYNYMFTSSNKYTTIKPWALELLLKWHRQDPISDKERDRNNAVEKVQGNRNPFVDYPELVEYIWGNKTSETFTLSKAVSSYSDEYKNGGTVDPDPGTGGGETPDPEASVPEFAYTFNVKLNSNFTGMQMTTDSDGAITYASSNPAVAEVDAQTGVVTLKAAGTVTITATTAETDSYDASSESYTLVISE